TTTQPRIHEWRSQLTRTISGCGNVMGIVRPRGCVRLNAGLAFGVLWRLCRRRSLFRKSIRPPAGTTTTRGTNVHSFWSIAIAGGGASFRGDAGGLSSQTTALRTPPCGDTTRSSTFFSLPHTYWSIVTASFRGAGVVPFSTTVPFSDPPHAARGVGKPPTSVRTTAPSMPTRESVITIACRRYSARTGPRKPPAPLASRRSERQRVGEAGPAPALDHRQERRVRALVLVRTEARLGPVEDVTIALDRLHPLDEAVESQ